MGATLRKLLEQLNESIGLLELEVEIFSTSPEVTAAAKAIRLRFDDLRWAMGRDPEC